ncbi:MAG TPA: hypothetical protein PKA41_07955 [Verrucomicrobiota bacterium]|nr:hypothetical protein [Verrucomicrobiota bacterium]
MTTSITINDLLTRLSQDELDELTATAIQDGQADPVATAIAGALGEIKLHLDPDALEASSEEMLYRLWLSLAVPLLYPRRAVVPEKHLKEQTWAREFLAKALKGEIPSLQSAGDGEAAYGSEKKFNPRNR